ncbi:hypothetical protein CPB83DRAFT_860362 [Crepidotus variabilis]|uniref:Carbohydrate esterase family 16 protein n=1 Tax=Crepidotus variabilis TaxID=179855 RepID=A0A9P6E9J3_9AGAR|nr:hypothetical protein CPB83DRAFT_860362 [Crepidotus variabilis]
MIGLTIAYALLLSLSATVDSHPSDGPEAATTISVATEGPNYWFSFGASSCQTGFNSTDTLPNEANPIGNPAFPGNTYSGGINWVGYLTSIYNNSVIFTYNYAIGGATINRTLVDPGPGRKTLTEQVDEFLSEAGTEPSATPWTSENALFSVYMGINDLQETYDLSGDRGAFSDLLLESYFAQAQRLYDIGARNFLLFNIAPTDRTPLMLNRSKSARATERAVIIEHNKRLLTRVNDFRNSTNSTLVAVYDIWTHFETMLNSPQTYGFKDATTFGNGSDIFWS